VSPQLDRRKSSFIRDHITIIPRAVNATSLKAKRHILVAPVGGAGCSNACGLGDSSRKLASYGGRDQSERSLGAVLERTASIAS
jgi:hypothetical protein